MIILVKCTESHREQLNIFLANDPLYNTFIRSDIDIYGFDKSFQTLYMTTNNKGQCLFVILIFHNIMILAGDRESLTINLVQSLLEDHIDIIMGKETLISQCRSLLSHDFDYSQKSLYALTDKNYLLKNPVPATVAKTTDGKAIHQFLNTFSEFKAMYGSLEMILNRISGNEGQHLFYEVHGQLIAHGNTAACTTDSCMIGGLATHENYRHQAYAKNILSQLSWMALAAQQTPCLLTDSYEGKSLFEDLGYELQGRWASLRRR